MTDKCESLRVLQVIGSMHHGGQESVVVNLVEGLTGHGMSVAVCCTQELGVLADALRDSAIDVRLAAPHTSRLKYLTPLFVRNAIRDLRPHVIHTHGIVSLLHLGPLAMVQRLPRWVHTFHYGNYQATQGRMWQAEGVFCKRATRLIAVSRVQRDAIISRHGLAPDSIQTIVNGVRGRAGAEPDDAVRLKSRRALGIEPHEVVMGTVAVLTVQKGVSYLLEAARRLFAADPLIRLLIVGGGPLESELRSAAAAMGLGSRVVFTGWRNDATALLRAMDIYVMSSLWEAMPMALLEAMEARLPLVVTDVGDNRWVVEGGRCGLLVPPKDPAAIVDAVTIHRRSPEAARQAAERAYRRFTEEFTVDRMVQDYATLYRSIVDERLTPVAARYV